MLNKQQFCLPSFFTVLHCMQRGICDRKGVSLSVCLSVTRVNCEKTNESSAYIAPKSPKGGLKGDIFSFPYKNGLRSKKVYCIVCFVKLSAVKL